MEDNGNYKNTTLSYTKKDSLEQSRESLIFDNQKWLTTKEAAEFLRKSVNAIHILISRGYIRSRKFRNRLYFNRKELNYLIDTSKRNGG